jgi:hypothetical protein
LQSVAGAALRLLDDGLDGGASQLAEIVDNFGDFGSLMSHDGQYLRGLESLAGAQHVFDERASASAMEHFGKLGTHASSLARSENDDRGVRSSHWPHIVAFPLSFSNRESGRVSAWTEESHALHAARGS